MSASYTVLITGANRGLGLGFTTRYVARPNTTVIAGVRDVAKSSQALQELSKGKDSEIIVVKIDSTSPTDALDAVKEFEKQGIRHLDLVIANAGVANTYPSVKDLKIEDLQHHMEPNVWGPVRLYQATIALLAKAAEPKWVTIGSMAGQISVRLPLSLYLHFTNA
jgi:norsolorinic acid ketoreductase